MVQSESDAERHEADALVAIDEGVPSDERYSQGSGQLDDGNVVLIRICQELLRPCECRIQGSAISYATCAAVFVEQFLV